MKKAQVLSGVVLCSSFLLLAGCTATGEDAKEASKITYTETAESTLNRPMENQPQAPYWFPEDLLQWEFAKDEDAKYNVSTEPLAKRVDKATLPKSNETQNEEMKVVALSIMNSSTSGNAPHGINTFDANVFSYWQYIDQLVYWGGSSGEGIIVPPSADVIDAAHKNGVPVLGTIFFPQTAHGGKIEWLDTFLEKDQDGHFPIVDKLVEVAQQFGFEGWFINQETDTEVTSFDDAAQGKEAQGEAGGLTKKHADLMQELITELKAASQDLHVMWYDSMTTDGKMDWQNSLTDKNQAYLVDAEMNPVADDMFLNFWWNTEELADKNLLKASKEKAEDLGIDPYDLYAGIDLQANGYTTPVQWDLFTDKNQVPYTSLGLYVPDWPYYSASAPDDYQMRENTFWVNPLGDPSQAIEPDAPWPGISTYAVEQTAITALPFVTNFNLGNGYNYFIEGQKVSSMDWNNRSMQDILPTYRWVMTHAGKNKLEASIDYAEAWQGGNSLKFRGLMEKDQTSTVKLYQTDFKVEKDIVFSTTAKATTPTALNLKVTLADGSDVVLKGKVEADWQTITYDTKDLVGKEVVTIGYEMSTEDTDDVYELHLGQLAITPKAEETKLAVEKVTIEDALFDEEEGNYAGVRLTWSDAGEQAAYYEIYRINGDDTRSFLGATPATNHYLNALERNDDTNKTNFEIVPVDEWGVRGAASKAVTLEWPDNSVPKANFTASRTLVAPGEKITFTNTSSANTESVTWEFEGADVPTSEEEAPSVSYAKEGTYTVKLVAKNEAGETPLEMTGFITVSKQASTLAELSKGATAEASSFVNDGEAPEFALDGKLDTKWCATGNPPHEITIDLGKVQTVSEVHMAHAEAGGESADMNTKAYTILVSEDGEEFTPMTRVISNEAAETVDTFTASPARFVKVIVDKPTQGSDTAVRLYDISVHGVEGQL